MLSPAHPPLIQLARRPAPRATMGFTLIELLTVIAIIGILAGATLGIMRGVNERKMRDTARVELAGLTTALDNYKLLYGDYPQCGTTQIPNASALANLNLNMAPVALLNALSGVYGPKLNQIKGKAWIDTGKYKLHSDLPTLLPDPAVPQTALNCLVDPWGRPYFYYYRTAALTPATDTWKNPSYVLYSLGPPLDASSSEDYTAAHTPPNAQGFVDSATKDTTNARVIYANQNN